MNENRIALMEQIDRIFVERVRSAATSEKRGVGALVDAYRYLKTVTLKGWEVRLLSRFRDPLAAALNVFGDAYAYTRAYREYARARDAERSRSP